MADPETYRFALRARRRHSFTSRRAKPRRIIFLCAFPNCILAAETPERAQAAQARLKPVPPPTAKLEPN